MRLIVGFPFSVVGDRDPEKDSHIGWAKIGNSTALRDVYFGKELKDFYAKLFPNPDQVQPLPNCTYGALGYFL